MNQEFNIKKSVLQIFVLLVGLAAIYLFLRIPDFVHLREREIKESREVTITVPEGLNIRQIGDLLEKNGLFIKDDFIIAAQKEEGYLFPDTYRFYKDAKPEDIISKMRENFDDKINEEI